MEPFNFKQFWLGMSKDERDAFAEEAGSTALYIMTHTQRKTRMPKKKFIDQLFKACKKRKPNLTKQELVLFFY